MDAFDTEILAFATQQLVQKGPLSVDDLDAKQGMKNFGHCTPRHRVIAAVRSLSSTTGGDKALAVKLITSWMTVQMRRAGLYSPKNDPTAMVAIKLFGQDVSLNAWSPMHLSVRPLVAVASIGLGGSQAEPSLVGLSAAHEQQMLAAAAVARTLVQALLTAICTNEKWTIARQSLQNTNPAKSLSTAGRYRIFAGLVDCYAPCYGLAELLEAPGLPDAFITPRFTDLLELVAAVPVLVDSPNPGHATVPHVCPWMAGRAYSAITAALPIFLPKSVHALLLELRTRIDNLLGRVGLLNGYMPYDAVLDPDSGDWMPAEGTAMCDTGGVAQWAYEWAETTIEHQNSPLAVFVRNDIAQRSLIRAFQKLP